MTDSIEKKCIDNGVKLTDQRRTIARVIEYQLPLIFIHYPLILIQIQIHIHQINFIPNLIHVHKFEPT